MLWHRASFQLSKPVNAGQTIRFGNMIGMPVASGDQICIRAQVANGRGRRSRETRRIYVKARRSTFVIVA